MAQPVGPRSVDLCQALKLNGYACGNKAYSTVIYRDEPLHLCYHHKEWRPENHKGRQHKHRRMTKREKAEKDKMRRRTAERCTFPNKFGDICQSPVTRRDEAQRPFCYYHWRQLDSATPEQKALLEQRMVESELFRAVGQPIDDTEHIEKGKRLLVKDMPTQEEQLQALELRAQSEKETIKPSTSEYGIQFSQRKPRGATMGKTQFLGIDIEHYTPDFKYDYLYLLFNQIRRAEAVVMVLQNELMRIEKEEELIKRTETQGTMMTEKGPVEFSNTTTRHVTPIETKLTLIDKLTKQEAHLSKLLKQLEELPLTCLTVFRKMGVKWDRGAAQMVIEAIEQEKMKTVEGYTTVDVSALPTKLDDVQNMIQRTQLGAPMTPEQVQTQKPEANW